MTQALTLLLMILFRLPGVSIAILKNITMAITWLVFFNPSKTEALMVPRRLIRNRHPPNYMQNQLITEVDTHKQLGIFFSSDCTWYHHIRYITEKAWTRINIMRKHKFKLDRNSLETNIFNFNNAYTRMWRCTMG